MQGYTEDAVLAHGWHSRLIAVTGDGDGRQYALKQVRCVPARTREEQLALAYAVQEARLLVMALKHPNIVRAHDFFVQDGAHCLVLELCAGGDLQGRIDAAVPSCSRRAVELMPATTFGWIVGIANAAAYFHLHGVIHRDLKPANILLASQTGTAEDVRVCDFGSARILHRHRGQDDVTTKPTGTRHYMAPEVTRQEAYDTSADIWSIGAIFLHLLTLRKPNPTALFRGDPLPVLPLLEHAGAEECLYAMLQVAPQRRPSPAVIVERLKRGTACSMCTHGDAGAHVEEGLSNIDVQLSRNYGDGSKGTMEGRAGRGDEMDEQASSGPPCACRVQ